MEDVLDVYHRPYDEKRPLVCLDEASKQLIVEVIERHPRHATILGVSPLHEQGRLPVTGGRGDADHAAVARAGGLDQPGAAHGAGAWLGDRELGIEQ